RSCAVVKNHLVASTHQVASHRQAHVPKTDKSDFHDFLLGAEVAPLTAWIVTPQQFRRRFTSKQSQHLASGGPFFLRIYCSAVLENPGWIGFNPSWPRDGRSLGLRQKLCL